MGVDKLEIEVRRVHSSDGRLPQSPHPLYLGEVADLAYRADGRRIEPEYFEVGSDISPSNVRFVGVAAIPEIRKIGSHVGEFTERIGQFDVGALVALQEDGFLLADQVFVAPQYWGREIAPKLIRDAIAYATENNLPLVLRAKEQNHKKYEKLGGTAVHDGEFHVHAWAPGFPDNRDIPGLAEIVRYVASRKPVVSYLDSSNDAPRSLVAGPGHFLGAKISQVAASPAY